MKNTKYLLIISLIVFIGNTLMAGSPLSNIKFYMAYQFNEKVQLAEQQGFVDGAIAFYLMDESVTIDQKAAVINALNWDEKGKNNADTYKMFLGRKYGKGYEDLDVTELTGVESFCLGYMLLLDKNRKLEESLPVLEQAQTKSSKSFTVNIIHALASAQNFLNNSDECNAWTVCNNVRSDATLTQDLNGEAMRIIFVEVDNYKNACN